MKGEKERGYFNLIQKKRVTKGGGGGLISLWGGKIHTVDIGLDGLRLGPRLSRHCARDRLLRLHTVHLPHVVPGVQVRIHLLGLQSFHLPVRGESR